jgi:transcriptional regulator with XRE-family HTH domain
VPSRQITRSEEHGRPVAARRMLGNLLRALRDSAGISPETAARRIGKDRTTLSRLEGGHSPFKDTDLDALLILYRIDRNERVSLLALNARITETPWWTPYRQHLASWYCSYLVLESAARYIFTYENRFIPGLLQTPEYAEAIIRARFTDDEQVRRLVDIRRHRQDAILEHPSLSDPATQLWAIIDNAALQDGLDSPGVMCRQIEFLKRVDAECPHVTVQVVTRGAYAARSNSFSILRLHPSMLAEVVYLEHLNDALFLDRPAQSDPYRLAWSEISLAVDKRLRTSDVLDQALQRLR